MTKKNLTIDDIARDLGVSKTTISRAISGKGRISAATRDKVMAYASKHNYRPSAAAKGLAERRTRNLMLVLPDTESAWEILRGVWEEALQQEYTVLLCFPTKEGKAVFRQSLDNHKVDGVILAVTDQELSKLLKQRRIPYASPAGCGELLRKLNPGSGQIG